MGGTGYKVTYACTPECTCMNDNFFRLVQEGIVPMAQCAWSVLDPLTYTTGCT